MANLTASTQNASNEEEVYGPGLNEMSNKFIAECTLEKETLGDEFPLSTMLIDEAIERVITTGRVPGREMYANVFKQKPIKVTQKVFVPTKQYPKFNFNGKILGPKGNSLRRLQEETLCKIKIKGRTSMRDSEKEEELRSSNDPRHAHLKKDLYVEISTVAPPAEAYARVAYALAEIRKYLIPDKNDEISQSQIEESMADPECSEKTVHYARKLSAKSQFRSQSDKKTVVSILQKLTGGVSEDDRSGDYEDRNEGYMRQYSQRTPAKRAPPKYQLHQYQGPEKRIRETSFGSQPKSAISKFMQKYK